MTTPVSVLLERYRREGISSPAAAPPPACESCGDTGYIRADVAVGHPYFGKVLPCPACHQAAPSQETDEFGLFRNDRQLTWQDALDLPGSNIPKAKRLIQDTLARGWGFVYLWGGYGTAKTTLLKIAVAEFIREQGVPASYTRLAEIMDTLRAGYDKDQSEALSRLRWWSMLPLLAIDEFEKIRETGFSDEYRFRLLDTRYEAATRQGFGVTLLAANVPPARLPPALASRINDGRFTTLELSGPDARPYLE